MIVKGKVYSLFVLVVVVVVVVVAVMVFVSFYFSQKENTVTVH